MGVVGEDCCENSHSTQKSRKSLKSGNSHKSHQGTKKKKKKVRHSEVKFPAGRLDMTADLDCNNHNQ